MRFPFLWFFIAGLTLLLFWQFPYAVGTTDQRLRLLYLLLFLMLLTTRSTLIRRLKTPQILTYALAWLGILLLLVTAYSFRNDIKQSRMFGELMPSRIQQGPHGEWTVTVAQDGHFHLEVEINGVLLNFLIDTGASDIVLSPHDATSIGLDPATLRYSRSYQTANGIVGGAPVVLATMKINTVTWHDIPASVNSAAMDSSLLGMAFLKQFSAYHVDGNRLTLIP